MWWNIDVRKEFYLLVYINSCTVLYKRLGKISRGEEIIYIYILVTSTDVRPSEEGQQEVAVLLLFQFLTVSKYK